MLLQKLKKFHLSKSAIAWSTSYSRSLALQIRYALYQVFRKGLSLGHYCFFCIWMKWRLWRIHATASSKALKLCHLNRLRADLGKQVTDNFPPWIWFIKSLSWGTLDGATLGVHQPWNEQQILQFYYLPFMDKDRGHRSKLGPNIWSSQTLPST